MIEATRTGSAQRMITFNDAMKLRPQPRLIYEHIRKACQDTNGFWSDVYPFLTGSAGTDSREFDHALVVDRLLTWDRTHGGFIAASGLSYRKLWQAFHREVSKFFDLENGHLVGLRIEDNSQAPEQQQLVEDEIEQEPKTGTASN